MIIPWHLIGAITPTSILIFIAPFDCGLEKMDYMDSVQVLQKTLKTREIGTSEARF